MSTKIDKCARVLMQDLHAIESYTENKNPSMHLSAPVTVLRKYSDVSSKVIIRSRIRHGNGWGVCKGLFLDYCRSTTVHGVRYIFSVHRPFYEKLYWLVLTFISFYFAVSLIWHTFLKWQDSPVILGFDETLVPVYKIPFPTVTICPEIKREQTRFDFTNVSERFWYDLQEYNGFENFQNLTQEELEYFAATLHICEEDIANQFVPFIPQTIRPDIARILVDLSISKNDTAPFCKFNGRFYFCHQIFNVVVTDEGICYQFNGLQAKDIYRNVSHLSFYDTEEVDFQYDFDKNPPLNNITGYWSLEGGYVDQGFNAYPQRTVFAAVRNAFFTILQGLKQNVEYACRSFQQGYRVYLNSPESVPLTTGNYILVSHGDEVLISVLPQYIIGDKSLREYPAEKRQCFFNDERYLRYFLYYSQANCQTECLVNFTIAKCGCVKFWMPKPTEIPVCDTTEINCYIEAQKDLNLLLQNQTLQKTLDPSYKMMCDCMPSCTSLEYNVEISSAAYDLVKTLEALREAHEYTGILSSRLSVYFKERQFTAIKRTVLFSITTFISNCGGIFGLFMGVSSLSFIEFLYFCSWRLFQNLRIRRTIRRKLLEKEAHHES